MTTLRLLAGTLAALAVTLGAPSLLGAQAPIRNHLYDKFQLIGALSTVQFTTTIRFDSDEGQGTDIDVEDDLGASSSVVEPRVGLRWNISRKHTLEFGYQFARRSGEREVQNDFEYQGETYEAGLLVKTKFNSDLASLTWRWAFHASDKSKIGATLGLGALFFQTALDGYLSVNDQSAEVSASRDLTAPVAGIGAFGNWQLSPAWYLELDVRGLYIPISRFEAIVGDISAAVRWWPLQWGGLEFGAGWNSVRVDINKDPEAVLTGDFEGQIKYRMIQPRVALVVAF